MENKTKFLENLQLTDDFKGFLKGCLTKLRSGEAVLDHHLVRGYIYPVKTHGDARALTVEDFVAVAYREYEYDLRSQAQIEETDELILEVLDWLEGD